MPYAAGDWICSSCWKSNRADDPLCYRCHKPRAGVGSDESADGTVSVRGDYLIPPLLVTLPAAFMRLYAVVSMLSVGLSILLLFLTLLGLGIARTGNALLVVFLVIAFIVLQVAIIWGLFAAARAITRHQRWGYFVGLLMTAPSAISGFLTMRFLPDAEELAWLPIVSWIGVAFYGILALLSLAAIAASFTRRDVHAGDDAKSASAR